MQKYIYQRNVNAELAARHGFDYDPVPLRTGSAANSAVFVMKPEIHPSYDTIKVVCACGNSFETRSTLGQELHVEICSACHPFYTGQQKIVDTAGRVGKFQKKYGRSA